MTARKPTAHPLARPVPPPGNSLSNAEILILLTGDAMCEWYVSYAADVNRVYTQNKIDETKLLAICGEHRTINSAINTEYMQNTTEITTNTSNCINNKI